MEGVFRNSESKFYKCFTDKKSKESFPHILGNSEGSSAKSLMTNDLLIYGENICAFPYILGSSSSYVTLHPIPSEFLIYEENFVFFLSFLSVCAAAPCINDKLQFSCFQVWY